MTMRIDKRTTKTGIESIKYMNERYIFEQLDLTLQQTDKREVFYIVRNRAGGQLDIKNVDKFAEANIDRYCKHLNKYLSLKYWVYVRDLLNIKADAIVRVFDIGMNTFELTDEPSEDYPNGTIEKFTKTSFYLLICEKKETIRAIMKELKNHGHNKGYYGISLSKNATSYAIKLLIKLSKIRNFHIFILHDLDISGLSIFLNMHRWAKTESIGVNPDFLKYSQIDNKDVDENYKVSNKDITGFLTILSECNLSRKENYKYMSWMWACLKKRIELNSISAYRLEQDLTANKVKDFCNYVILKIEDPERKWDLNRYRKPKYRKPILRKPSISSSDFMQNVEKDLDNKIECIKDILKNIRRKIYDKLDKIEDKAYEGIYKFLEDEDLRYSSDWENLIQDQYNKIVITSKNVHNLQSNMVKLVILNFMRKNKRFKGDIALKNPDPIISKQENRRHKLNTILSNNMRKIVKSLEIRCKRLIKRTEKFKDFKEKLVKNEDNLIKTRLVDYLTKLKEYIVRELETLMFIIKLDSIIKRAKTIITR